MKLNAAFLAMLSLSTSLYAESDQALKNKINNLQEETQKLQSQLAALQNQLSSQHVSPRKTEPSNKKDPLTVEEKTHPEGGGTNSKTMIKYHSSHLTVHTPEEKQKSVNFFPTALVADNRVITYVAGTPVITSPYLGDRPAFDGSDYIVNISSINRDIRLMQQRRRLYNYYRGMGYPIPDRPIISISGKTEPFGYLNSNYIGNTNADLTLGSSEIAVAAALNQNVEGYISLAYDESPPEVGPRIDNSAFSLNMGFVNIGNLDKTPFYFTAGQLYVPFGRYSSSMISSPLPLNLSRTKTRPFILGYKSQEDNGPFAAVYAFRSDTNLGRSGVGGVNLGETFTFKKANGEIGFSYISSINDAAGMQYTAAKAGNFDGFGALLHGTERVRKTQAIDFHGNLNYDRFNFAAEWVSAIQSFRRQDLSYNNHGARPQALQTEIDMTFKAFNRPSSVGVTYQWSKEALALNIPKHRIAGVFNISIWRDTVESIEYRHDIDYSRTTFANGASAPGVVNTPTVGSGHSADTVSAQIGVYF